MKKLIAVLVLLAAAGCSTMRVMKDCTAVGDGYYQCIETQ